MCAASKRVVFFDLDGTLYDDRGLRWHMAVALWRSLGLLRALFPALDTVRGKQFPDAAALWDAVFAALARGTGKAPDQVAHWYHRAFLPAFVSVLRRRFRARPGVVSAVERLRAAGVRVGVVSDFGAVAERLDALDIPPETFDFVFASEEFGVLKPSPVPFRTVAATWDIPSDQAIVVGDRWDRDGESARLAQMDFVAVGGSGGASWTHVMETVAEKTNVELSV